MSKVRTQIALASPAATVWAFVGPFGAVADWHPVIQRSEVSEDGKVRTLQMPDGSTSQERLITHDDAAMQYRYTLHGKSTLPVLDFQGTVTVQPFGERSLFTWEADFDVPKGVPEAQVVAILQRIFDAPKAGLAERFGA